MTYRSVENSVAADEQQQSGPPVGCPAVSVIFFIHTPRDPQTAVFSNVMQRAAHLIKAGHSAAVLAPEDFGWLGKLNPRWYPLLYAWFVAGYLATHRDSVEVAIFHSHAGWVFNFFRLCRPSLKKIVTITQFHGLEPIFFEGLRLETKKLTLRFRLIQKITVFLIKASCRRSERVYCQNSIERDYLIQNHWAAGDRIVQYSNGAPSELLSPREYDRPVSEILFLGQWIERKGIGVLPGAFAAVRRRHPDARLICLGTLRAAETVLADFPEELRDGISVVPRFQHSDLRRYMATADLFVFPSISEGFGTALLEAMASGLPVVSTNVGLAPDLLKHNLNALLVPIKDTPSLANSINRLLDDAGLRRRLGKAAQATAADYTWASVCERYARSILLLRRKPRRAPTLAVFFIHTPKDPSTAVFNAVAERAADLSRSGCETKVVAPRDFNRLARMSPRWYPLVYSLFVTAYLVRRRRTTDIAIFHSHAGWAFNLIRPWFRSLDRIKTVTQFHGLEPLFFEQMSKEKTKLTLRYRLMQGVISKSLIKASCRRSDQVYCLNSEERKYLIQEQWASENRIIQSANGFPSSLIKTRDYERPVQNLLFIGQWVERKGIRVLANLLNELRKISLRVKLWCVGTLLPAEGVLQSFSADLHPDIEVIPRFSPSELQALLDLGDIFVFPTNFEGFSMALVEAMAAGLPIVTTPVAAAIDLLTDEVEVLFVPTNDSDLCAKAILRLAHDSKLRERLGRQAQLKAREFTWEKVCQRDTKSILSMLPSRTGKAELQIDCHSSVSLASPSNPTFSK